MSAPVLEMPCIIVNLKVYKEAYGRNALELARAIAAASKGHEGQVAVACGAPDIRLLACETELPVFAQHIDPIPFGGHTGHILAEAVADAGAVGTLINHAEFRQTLANIEACVARAREANLMTCVCTNNVPTSAAVAAMGPDIIAVEPPELIGGDISVSSAKPEVISGSVEAVARIDKHIAVLCGAGVKNGKDVRKSIELGAKGVLLASGVVKAKDVGAVMKDLLSGL